MLEDGDIEYIESIINVRFPLRNCGPWNRIKTALAEAQKPSPNTGSLQYPPPCYQCSLALTCNYSDGKACELSGWNRFRLQQASA